MKITKLAIERRIATSVLLAAMLVLGFYGLWRLPVDFLPDMTYPLIKVHIWWRGATPEEIELNLAEPIERQMATVDGLDYLESSSIEGMYTLQANFQYGVTIETAYQDALAAMARVARELPADIEPPVIIKADPSQLPVAQLTVRSNTWDLVQLRTWTDNWLQDQLVAVPGVAGTEIVGGLKREIRVHLDPDALEKYQLTLSGVIRRVADENIELFGGRFTQGSREYIARTIGQYRSIEDIASVVVASGNGSRVLLGDIAEVKDAHEEVRVITRLDGDPCVKLSVLKQADANTVNVASAVMERIDILRPSIPEDVQIGIVENQAEYVKAALGGVRTTAFEAAILVILTVFLFLGSWRQVAVIITALPITLVLNFGLMKLAGFSLNIFSLGGLVVAIGVLLDNSIVVLENISRLRISDDKTSLRQIVVEATSQVGPAVVAATLTFLALFVPFLLVPGLTSLLFQELILVISGIVLISLVVSVTITPLLSEILLRPSGETRAGARRFERFYENVSDRYRDLLERALLHKRRVVGAFGVVLVLAIVLVPFLNSEFLPKMDDGRVMVKVKLPTGAAIGQTDEALRRLEAAIGDDPLVESAFTLAGGKVWGLYTYEIANEGEINLQLVPRKDRPVSTKKYIAQLEQRLRSVELPAGRAMVMPMKLKGLRQTGESDVDVKIRGDDMETLFELALGTRRTMEESGAFRNVRLSMDLNKPEYQIEVDRVRAAELGVSIADVASTLQSLVRGSVAGRYREGAEYYGIRVMIPEEKITSRRDIENLTLNCAQGGYVRMQDVALVREATGPVEIVRENQVKQVIVQADVAAGTSVGGALREIRSRLDAIDRPVGYQFSFGGQAQMMSEMIRSVVFILLFAVFFAFVVLATQFNSLKLPALILGTVPFSLAGLVFILAMTGVPLGATVVIGVIVVVAATVNDGVLLLTFAEELRERNRLSAWEAVLDAARIRLRPRLMTTLPILAGFLPLALNLEVGGDMLQPMALAAVGGLLTEMAAALFLMPCLYILFTSEKPVHV